MALQMPTSTMQQQSVWDCRVHPAQQRCWSSTCCVPFMLAGKQVCLARVSYSCNILLQYHLEGSPCRHSLLSCTPLPCANQRPVPRLMPSNTVQ